MNNNFWTGKNVFLRAVERNDAGAFFKYDASYDDESDRLCDEIHFPSNYDSMLKRVEASAGMGPVNDEFRWIIENRDHKAVGNINTFDCSKKNGTFKYGLGIVRDNWGQGYAKEAIEIVLRYYFLELRYQKVTIYVYSFNDRSIKLHEKMGFQNEGRIRRAYYTNGQYYDEILYGMTKEEFESIYNTAD